MSNGTKYGRGQNQEWATMATPGGNSNSVIPPVARRKLMMRAQRQNAQRLANILWGSLLSLCLIGFWVYHRTYLRTRKHISYASRRWKSDISPHLRGARGWINQESLPFVSHEIELAPFDYEFFLKKNSFDSLNKTPTESR